MHPHLDQLHPYPFERLNRLMAGIEPPQGLKPIPLTIGEPKHAAPEIALRTWNEVQSGLSLYPNTQGTDDFRESIAQWATRRFRLTQPLDPHTMILPINGTREGLFAIAQVLVGAHPNKRRVLMPNPFYQIYEGAALLAGGQPTLLDLTADDHFQPQWASIPDHIWAETAFVYVCSPNNPTGSVIRRTHWEALLERAERFDFVVIADECYSEIYPDDALPPTGLLEVAQAHPRYARSLVFHSLSKRSSLPGLRSGFVAGDPTLIEAFRRYRTYHGCALPIHVQKISQAAWGDETHVVRNRELYRAKFKAVVPLLQPVLTVAEPEAGFYLWPHLDMDDEVFTQKLYAATGVAVLPGRYLGRANPSHNPGERYVRISLVASVEECVEAAHRIRQFMEQL